MNPPISFDIPVSVWPQSREVDAEARPLYEGISGVILNRVLTVMFVPQFARRADNWPPIVPEDIDTLSTPDEARRLSAAMASYTVTPDPQRAGEVETIPAFDPELPEPVIFYVGSADFAVFARELSEVAQHVSGNSSSMRLFDLGAYEFARYLLTNVLASDHFSLEDAQKLRGGSK